MFWTGWLVIGIPYELLNTSCIFLGVQCIDSLSILDIRNWGEMKFWKTKKQISNQPFAQNAWQEWYFVFYFLLNISFIKVIFEGPTQIPWSVASDLGFHCLSNFKGWKAIMWEKNIVPSSRIKDTHGYPFQRWEVNTFNSGLSSLRKY